MSFSSDLEQLKKEDRTRLQDYTDRFDKAWQGVVDQTESVGLSKFLPHGDDPLRPLVLRELVKSDMEARWRRGQTLTLDFYLDKFPELGTREKVAPQLVFEEYRIRYLYGDRPPLESTYRSRFPTQYAEVQRLLQDQPLSTVTIPISPSEQVPASGNRPTTPLNLPGNRPATPLSMGSFDVLQVGGGYKLIKRIGKGSFGEVWRAEAPGGVPAAIKIIIRSLDDEEGRRELKSLDLLKQLSHPFLLQTYAYWAMEDRLVIAMDLADGSLRDESKKYKLAGKPGIPLPELIGYFREAAEAVDYLHAERVLHRDIKPDNILIKARHAKVCDFGMSRVLGDQWASVTGTACGTPAFMAPELWTGHVHQHSDQYSLAGTYAELRLGRLLFPFRNMIDMMSAHLEKAPDLAPLPEEEQKVLLRALAKKPDERFKSCKSFIRALEKSLPERNVEFDSGTELIDPSASLSGPRQTRGSARKGKKTDLDIGLKSKAEIEPDPSQFRTLDVKSEEFLSLAETLIPPVPGLPEKAPPAGRPKPQERPVKKKPRLPQAPRSYFKAAVVGVFLVLGGLTGAAFFAKQELEGRFKPLMKEGKYDEAIHVIDDSGPLAWPFRTGSRQKVLEAWQLYVQTLLQAKSYESAETSARDLLARFSGDPTAARVLEDALAHNIPPLIDNGKFDEACDRLETPGFESETVQAKFRPLILTRWQKLARKKYEEKKYLEAGETARKLLKHFPNNPIALEVLQGALPVQLEEFIAAENYRDALSLLDREGAHLEDGGASLRRKIEGNVRGRLKNSVDKLRGKGQYQEALSLTRKDADLLSDHGQGFKEEILKSWFEKAQAEYKAEREKEAAAICAEILKTFKDDGSLDVQFVEELAAQIKNPDVHSVVKLLDNGKALLGKDAKQARVEFDRAAAKAKDYPDLQNQARLGRARVFARLDDWDKVKQEIAEFKTFSSPADKAHSWALESLMEAKLPAAGAGHSSRLLRKISPLLKKPEELDSWERTHIQQLGRGLTKEVLGAIDLKATPDEKLTLVNELLELDLGQKETLLLKKADIQYRKNDFKGSRETLGQLADKEQPPVKILTALVLANDKNANARDRDQAAGLLNDLLKKPGERTVELCQAYAVLADRDDRRLDAALEALAEARDHQLKPGKEKEHVGKYYQGLMNKKIEKTVARPEPKEKTYWTDLRKKCSRADPSSGWVRACLAECLFEEAMGQPPKKDLDQVREALFEPKTEKEAGSYAHYARALVHRAAGEMEPAAAAMIQAYPAEPPPEPLQWLSRRNRAVETLRLAAKALHNKDEAEKPGPNPFGTSENADKAHQWLAKANALADGIPAPSWEVRSLEAMAAWHKPQRDAALARDLAGKALEKIKPDQLEAVHYPLLLIRAQAREETDQGARGALASYSRIRQLVEDKKLKLPALTFHKDVLDPAVTLGEKLLGNKQEEHTKKELARFHAAAGQLLRVNLYERWPTDFNPGQKAFEAYRRACVLDDTMADYLVGMAYARLNLDQPDLAEIEKWAKQAKALDGANPGVQGLLGYVWHVQARNQQDPKVYLSNLTAAVEAYQEAIKLCEQKKDRDQQLYIILTNRSAAFVELGSTVVETNPSKRHRLQKEYLDNAWKDARRATELNPRYAFAWDALGNALEDFSWMLNEKVEDEKQLYDKAKEAFDEAVNLRSDFKKFRLDRGRCQFKRVKYGNQNAHFLDEAVNDLTRAVEAKAPQEAAQANYWLGLVHQQRADYPKAEECLKKATELVQASRSREWEVYALAWAQLSWDRAEALLQKKTGDPEGLQRVKTARDLCLLVKPQNFIQAAALLAKTYEREAELELAAAGRAQDEEAKAKCLKAAGACVAELKSCKHFEAAAFIQGRMLRLEGKPKAALAAFDEGLPPDLANADKSHLRLLLGRLGLLMSGELKKNPRTKPELLLADADAAIRLAEQAPPFKPAALSTAALARIRLANSSETPPETGSKYRKKAAEQLEDALKLAPKHSEVWFWAWQLGLQHKLLDNKDKAQEWLRKARSSAPEGYRQTIDEALKELD